MPFRARLSEAVRQVADPSRIMQRVADQAVALIPGADGALIALWDGDDILDYVCGAGRLSPYVGVKVRVNESLAGLTLRRGEILRSDDTVMDPRVDADACRSLNVNSALCIPLVKEGSPYGVLTVSSEGFDSFDAVDEETVECLIEFVGVVVGASLELERVTTSLLQKSDLALASVEVGENETSRFVANVLDPRATDDFHARHRIERALETASFSMVFQPIINLDSNTPIAVEALTRFAEPPERSPDLWFAEAHSTGLGVALELAAIERALEALTAFPRRVLLAVNAGVDTLVTSELLNLLESVDARQVIVELTEHTQVDDYPGLIRALAAIRATGARLAIDDTGAGISSLAHILKLSPEIIKLDRALTTTIDRDPVRRALATSLVRFAADTGPMIVAEGIENADELRVLRDLGIRYGQGYHLARPAPLRPLDSPLYAST